MSDIVLQPDPRRKRLVIVVNAPDGGTVAAEISGTGVRAEGTGGPLQLSFPDFVPWTPSQPHLYSLSVTAAGELAQLPFGMREISLHEQRVCINQRPIVLKGTRLWTGTESDGAIGQIAALLAAGFNFVRSGHESITPKFLEVAAERGLMVFVDLRDVSSVERTQVIVRGAINATAVIAWECTGEEIAETIRELDPTRPVFAGDRVHRPFHPAPDPVMWSRAKTLTPIARETETLLSRTGHARAINLISLSGFSPPALDGDLRGLIDPDGLDAHVAGSVRVCVDALRSNPRLAGYCFEDALKGGGSKARLDAFTESQAAVRPVIAMSRSNLVPREEVDVGVTLLNDARVEGRGELSLQVVGPTNQVLWKKKRGVKLPKHGKELWTGTVAASGSVGTHRFVVRVMDEREGIIGESSVSFHVCPPAERWSGAIDIVDPGGKWLDAIKSLAPQIDATAPIVLMPRLASSIRAWPDNALGQALGRVREGAVGIVFDPPGDWGDLGATLSTAVEAKIGSMLDDPLDGSVGVARLHPLFEGLPAGGPLARPYRGIVGSDALRGESEEDISPVAQWNGQSVPGHRVVVRRFGSGRLVFITFRLLERLGTDPVVDRLFVNLLRHSERRAIESKEIAKVESRAIEWLRRERGSLRVWRIIGPFPNWDGDGHNTAYPPEAGYDATAAYAGWYRAAGWLTWHQRPEDGDEVPLSRLLRPQMVEMDPCPGTYYAYTDLTSEERVETRVMLRHTGTAKCWLNGRALQLELEPGADTPGANVVLKQGRNALLVKLSTAAGPAKVALRLSDNAGLRWL